MKHFWKIQPLICTANKSYKQEGVKVWARRRRRNGKWTLKLPLQTSYLLRLPPKAQLLTQVRLSNMKTIKMWHLVLSKSFHYVIMCYSSGDDQRELWSRPLFNGVASGNCTGLIVSYTYGRPYQKRTFFTLQPITPWLEIWLTLALELIRIYDPPSLI